MTGDLDQATLKIIGENMNFSSELEGMIKDTTHTNISMILKMFQNALNELEESLREGTVSREYRNIPDIMAHSGKSFESVDIESMQSVLRFLSERFSTLHDSALEMSSGTRKKIVLSKYIEGIEYLRKRSEHMYHDLVEKQL